MILLDTHTLIWWVSADAALSTRAKDAIDDALGSSEILISSITAWEIAMLVTRERLVLSMDVESWLATVAQIDNVRFIAINNDIAIKSTQLPGNFHKDPADRMIVATARKFSIPLVTKDEKILAYPHVKKIW